MRNLKYWLVVIALGAGLMFVLPLSAPSQDAKTADPEKILRGHDLFRIHGCMECHTILGKGGGSGGPDLKRVTVWASPLLGAAVMWNHVELMKIAMEERQLSWPRFREGEIGDIFAFVHSLNPQKSSIAMYPGEADLGRENYLDAGCRTCHGEPFGGGRIGPDVGETAWRSKDEECFAALMLTHSPTMIASPLPVPLAKDGVRIWPRLTGNQMANLYAYLRSIPPPKRR
jgi:mono/diheme cytochrome c family protein